MARQKRQNGEDQQHLDGMEPMAKNTKVHNAALRYVRERNARLAANEAEKDAHDTLLDKMREAGLDQYVSGNIEVHIDNKQKCRVKSGSAAESDDDGDE